MSDTPITEKDIKNLLEQLGRVHGDKDRVRLINAASDGFSFTCAQVKQIITKGQYGDAQRTICINLYGKCTDTDNFESVVISSLKFEEDKKEVREALGL